MQLTEIMITHILPTGTTFAVIADDMKQSVFVPSKLSLQAGLQQSMTVGAIIVPNLTHADKTPWVAIKIDRQGKSFANGTADTLADMILADLREGGMATSDTVADGIDYPALSVMAKMQEMERRGVIYKRTYYAVDPADFEVDEEWHKLDGNMRAADEHYDGGEKICPWCGEEIEADCDDWLCDECEFSDEEAKE